MTKEEWNCLRDVLVAYFKAEFLIYEQGWYDHKKIEEAILGQFLVQRTLEILHLTPEQFMEMVNPPDPPMDVDIHEFI